MDSTGSHKVKFLEDSVVLGKDQQGNPRKEIRYIVEEDGVKYRWQVPILNKEQQPHYLIEQLMEIKVGEEVILEMKRRGARNYILVIRGGGAPEQEEETAEEDEGGEGETLEQLFPKQE